MSTSYAFKLLKCGETSPNQPAGRLKKLIGERECGNREGAFKPSSTLPVIHNETHEMQPQGIRKKKESCF